MKQPQGNDKQDDKDDEHEHEHVHGPGCDHDHDEGPKGSEGPKAPKGKVPTEEEFQKQLTMLEVARNRIETFGREADILASALRDAARATETLTAVKKMGKKPAEILIPVGSGVFIYAKPASTQEVIMNIGNGISVEYSVTECIEKLETSIKDLSEKEKKIVAELQRLEQSAEALTREVQGMYEQMQRARK